MTRSAAIATGADVSSTGDGFFGLMQRVLPRRLRGAASRCEMCSSSCSILPAEFDRSVHGHAARLRVAQRTWLAAIVVADGQNDVSLVLIADTVARQTQTGSAIQGASGSRQTGRSGRLAPVA
jgi:hypothetical protein